VKNKYFLLLAAVLTLTLVYCSPPKTITLIHSNDTHGIYKPYKIRINGRERLIGGMLASNHYICQLRARGPRSLLIETGDMSTGTLASEIKYKGLAGGAMIEFLNRLGYDIWCLGNHDFDKGQENVLALAQRAKFPAVMANIFYKKSGQPFPVKPYHIFNLSGLKIGIIAVMEENFLIEVSKKSTEGLEVRPIIPTLESFIPALDKKTDLIIVLAHAWFKEGLRIAHNISGIDAVLVASEDGQFEEVKGIPVQSTYGHQRTLGYLKLKVKRDRVVSYEHKLIWLWADIDLKEAPSIKSLIDKIDSSIASEYGQIIGQAKSSLTLNSYHSKTPPIEILLGDWITDVMRWKTGAQIGFYNSGGIRAEIKAGPITKADVFNVVPFHNTLVVFKLSGQLLKNALEYDIERGWDRLQVSGLRYNYYSKQTRPYGHRIDFLEVNGEVIVQEGKLLKPKEQFTVVSNDYVAEHAADKYFKFPVSDLHNTGLFLYQSLVEWLQKYKSLDYKPQQRIVHIIE